MRKILAFCTATVFALATWAAAPRLTVNGIAAEKVPTNLTFDGDNVIVHFGDDSEVYDLESVEITFPTSGLSNIHTYALDIKVGDILTVEGLASGTEIEIYDMSGMLRASAVVSDKVTIVDIKSCNAGVYILKAGNEYVKFIKH